LAPAAATVGGSIFRDNARLVLMSDAMPAAPSVCPMLFSFSRGSQDGHRTPSAAERFEAWSRDSRGDGPRRRQLRSGQAETLEDVRAQAQGSSWIDYLIVSRRRALPLQRDAPGEHERHRVPGAPTFRGVTAVAEFPAFRA